VTLFKGGILVTGQEVKQADLRVEGERITDISSDLNPQGGEKVYEIPGKLLLPGIIDAHTHFLLRSRNAVTADDVYHGGIAAAQGGVTTVIDYADQLAGRPLLDGIEVRRRDFDDSVIDYSFHLVLNDNYESKQSEEFVQVLKAGITSVKLFTTYKEAGYMLAPEKWYGILKACKSLGMVVTVHAEDDATVQWT